MRPIRVSFSILKAWERGQVDRAMEMLLGIKGPETEPMIHGKLFHAYLEENPDDRIDRIVLQGSKSPLIREKKITRKLFHDLPITFVGILDASTEDKTRSADHKTGKTPLSAHYRSRQLDFYALLSESPVNAVLTYLHYPDLSADDPIATACWMSYLLTEDRMHSTREWAYSLGSEIVHQLQLINRYDDVANRAEDVALRYEIEED